MKILVDRLPDGTDLCIFNKYGVCNFSDCPMLWDRIERAKYDIEVDVRNRECAYFKEFPCN